MLILMGGIFSQGLIAQNQIAVLPFDFTSNEPGADIEGMQRRIQSECVSALRSNTSGLTIQDPMTTNALLNKNNLDASNVRTELPADVAKLLGVQYVVYGSAYVRDKGTTSTGSSVTTYNEKEEKDKEQSKSTTKDKGSAVTTTSSTTVEQYKTEIELNIYDANGQNQFSQTREPFSADPDSFKSALDYMLKRSPWGSKHK